MSKLFYATRMDKSGNKLITSYTSAKSCQKYGGVDSRKDETIYYANITAEKAEVSEIKSRNGAIMRSMLINNGSVENSGIGRYLIVGKSNGKWAETPFRFSQYGAANTVMKNMISLYQALIIVDTDDETDDYNQSDEWEPGMNSELEVTGEI